MPVYFPCVLSYTQERYRVLNMLAPPVNVPVPAEPWTCWPRDVLHEVSLSATVNTAAGDGECVCVCVCVCVWVFYRDVVPIEAS